MWMQWKLCWAEMKDLLPIFLFWSISDMFLWYHEQLHIAAQGPTCSIFSNLIPLCPLSLALISSVLIIPWVNKPFPIKCYYLSILHLYFCLQAKPPLTRSNVLSFLLTFSHFPRSLLDLVPFYNQLYCRYNWLNYIIIQLIICSFYWLHAQPLQTILCLH